eukprot:gene6370-7922_t
MTAAVLFENVSRHFGAVRAVDAVDLAVAEGEFFAMLGPSGSGKTTCLRLMAGFEQPTGGHIEIFGETAEGVPPYRRNVNTVFQDYALFPHLSILDNVAYGLMVKGVAREERRKAAEDALAMTRFVADFVGSSNILQPEFVTQLGAGRQLASLRPEAIELTGKKDGQLSLSGIVLSRSFLGASNRITVDVSGTKLHVTSPAASPVPEEGSKVTLSGVMSAITSEQAISTQRPGLAGRVSDFFWKHPHVFLAVILAPPLLWLGIIYLGSLLALLLQSFFSIDDYSGLVNYEFTLATYGQLLNETNLDIIIRTVCMAAIVTLFSALIAFPIAYYAARYAKGKWKALFYLGVMLPLWSSYLVKIYAWKLILAKEGILTWLLTKLNLLWLLDAWLSLPVIGGNSLSVSYTGTFIVFVYVWMPFMILPIQASLERVPYPAADIPPCTVSAGSARHRCRIDLHLFADAG